MKNEIIDKRLDAIETKVDQMSVDIAEIKTILTGPGESVLERVKKNTHDISKIKKWRNRIIGATGVITFVVSVIFSYLVSVFFGLFKNGGAK